MTFTVEDVLREMRAVVKERGEGYVYQAPDGKDMCVYMDGDKPSCLVGHVVLRLAPDKRHALRQADTQKYGGTSANHLHEFLGEDFWTNDAGDVAAAAQEEQDSLSSWGEALAEAERFAKGV